MDKNLQEYESAMELKNEQCEEIKSVENKEKI